MKRILLFASLISIGFLACKKDNNTYDGSLNGRWELSAISEPYAVDKGWKPVPDKDSSTLILNSDATYSFNRGNYYSSTGTFTVTDSTSNIKVLTFLSGNLSATLESRLLIQKLSARELKMDYSPGCGAGYTSRKYEKKN